MCLCSGKEETLHLRVSANRPRKIIGGNSVNNLRPRLAVVLRLIQEWAEVIGQIHRRGNVGRTRIERRSRNAVHSNEVGALFTRDLGPVLASVPRQMDQSIIRAYPDDTLLYRRFIDRE